MRHDDLYRDLTSLRKLHITVCGCGALGSRVALELARLGVHLTLVDFDIVEEHNVFNQIYTLRDVGAKKVNALANIISLTVRVTPDKAILRITAENVKKLKGDLIIDTFDNVESRAVLRDYGFRSDIPVLHVGVSADVGEVVWNHADYLSGTVGAGDCEVPLALTNVLITSGIAVETAVQFSLGKRRNTRFYLPLMEMRHDSIV